VFFPLDFVLNTALQQTHLTLSTFKNSPQNVQRL